MSEDPYKYFRIEAVELLDELSRAALALEKAGDSQAVARALRHAHTLKGAARVVRLPALAEIAHHIEDLLAPFRNRDAALGADEARRFYALLDNLKQGLGAIGAAGPAAAPVEDATRSVRAELTKLETLLDAANEAAVAARSVLRDAERLSGVSQLAQALVARLAAVDMPSRKTVELAEQLREQLSGSERALQAGLQQSVRELVQVVELADQLRLVRIDSIEVALQRTARDAAEALGKRVELVLTGGDARVEADVLAALQDALIQLVRNAVAHGIEAAPARVRAGKPEVGRIVIEVARRNRGVAIRCRDDGAGIDAPALRRAAGATDSTSLLDLLVRGGVSTAPRVTAVAGRGIGLELVAEATRNIGGTLSVETERGAGTVFSIALPAALSAAEVLSFECAGSLVALPLKAVTVVRRLRDNEIVQSGQREAIVHGDATIPLERLARALGAATHRAPASTVVVMAAGGGSLALVIDRVVGVATVVVRAIPEVARVAAFVAGASIDAEGRAQLILDPEQLAAEAAGLAAPSDAGPRVRHSVLVVDDSMTTRMLEQSILEAAGYEVDLAVSAEHGLETAKHKRYSLFLVDVEMPGMDGFTFIERVRADPALRDTPAMLVSSRNDAADFQRGRDVGAQGYVVKGEFDQTSFLSQIAALLRIQP